MVIHFLKNKIIHTALLALLLFTSSATMSLFAVRHSSNYISVSGEEINELLSNGVYYSAIKAENTEYHFDGKGRFIHTDNAFSERQFQTLKEQNKDLIEIKEYHNKMPVSLVFSKTTYFVEGKMFKRSIDPELHMIVLPKKYDGSIFEEDDRFINKDICKLPSSETEVAVTDLLYDYYVEYGFVNNNTGFIDVISSPDDLIGKQIDDMSIVGVFKTQEDNKVLANVLRQRETTYSQRFHLSASLISSASSEDERLDATYLTSLPRNNIKCLQYLKKFSYRGNNGSYMSAKLASPYTKASNLKSLSKPETHLTLMIAEIITVIIVGYLLLVNAILFQKKKPYKNIFKAKNRLIRLLLFSNFVFLISTISSFVIIISSVGFNGIAAFLSQFLNISIIYVALCVFYGAFIGLVTFDNNL